MKIVSVIQKSFKEQMRQFWLLLLTVSMAPFFIFVYYLIIEGSKVSYDLLVVNLDRGARYQSENINHGELLTNHAKEIQNSGAVIPLKIKSADNREIAIESLIHKKADAVVVIPVDFSERIQKLTKSNDGISPEIEFVGDLTNTNYIITAIWANEALQKYITEVTGKSPPLKVTETALGSSAKIDDFTYSVPGLLILSIIMLMFTAAIALVTEVENKTMLRLKLSRLSAFEFLASVSVVQIIVGLISILLALAVAVVLGFHYSGSLPELLFIATLTGISVIAFSLILAALTRTVNEVLIVGNFPLFLFMFFTGVAYPVTGRTLFTVSGYPITLPGLMSPSHAVSALRKILILNMDFMDVFPEIIALLVLTAVYFTFGIWAFNKRHMRVD